MSVPTFEQAVQTVCNQILNQIYSDLTRLTNHGWHATTGANYEGVYNASGLGANDAPPNGQITQSTMNNTITAFNAIKAVIEAQSGALAKGGDK